MIIMNAANKVALAVYATWGATYVTAFAVYAAKEAVKNQTARNSKASTVRKIPTKVLKAELDRRETDAEFLKIMHENKMR